MTDSHAISSKVSQNEAATIRLVIRAEIIREEAPVAVAHSEFARPLIKVAIGIAALLAMTWIVVAFVRPDSSDGPRSTQQAQLERIQSPAASSSAPAISKQTPTQLEPSQPSTQSRPELPPSSEPRPDQHALPQVTHEQLPKASPNALQTIRGTVRVLVSVSINSEGKVTAATAIERGPSRYFERLALSAARNWTFAPSAMHERTSLVRFNYTRDGVKATLERGR